MNAITEPSAILKAWLPFKELIGSATAVRTEADYVKAIEYIDELLTKSATTKRIRSLKY